MGGSYLSRPKRARSAPDRQHLNAYGDYEVCTEFINAEDLNTIAKKDVRPAPARTPPRFICSGHGPDVSENNLIVTWETFGQTIWWLVNYLIVARVARQLHNHYGGIGYIIALSTCLFIFMFATTLMKRSSDQALYSGFLLFVFVCIYFK